jgi:hypothetical protein
VDQCRGRLNAALTFRSSDAYLDFEANVELKIQECDLLIDDPPRDFLGEKQREQAIGERRYAREAKAFINDYILAMQLALNSALEDQGLPPEDLINPKNI